MLSVFFELADGYEVEITKRDVFQSENVDELCEWKARLGEVCEELGFVAEANKECGVEDYSLAKKYGVHKIAKNWVSKRLKALGHVEAENEKELRQAQTITQLLRQNAELRDQVAQLEQRVAA